MNSATSTLARPTWPDLLVAEFATAFAGDWFVVPITVPVGTLTEISSVEVIDTFGGRRAVPSPRADWERAGPERGWRAVVLPPLARPLARSCLGSYRSQRPGTTGAEVLMVGARWLRTVAVVGAAVALVAVGTPAALAHPPGVTELVSVSSAGAAGDNDSSLASISGDGRYVAFWSFASNLVPGDTNGTSDVFVRDRVAGTTERVSVDSKGRQSTGGDAAGVLDTNLGRPVITPDGRFVAFASSATNLVKQDRNNAADIFLRDRVAGTTELVTTLGRKTQANGESSQPAISPDARFVAFTSFADNLVPGDTNFTSDVFRLDRQTGTVVRVSVTSTGQQADTASGSPAITPDGRLLAFESSSVLVPGEVEDSALDVYLREVQAGTTEGISTPTTGLVRHSVAPAITADGRFVAFQSWDGGLVPGDTNDRYDIFVFDRSTGVYERVSVDSAGVEGNNDSIGPALSADGRFVAFTSDADNLVAGDGNFDLDVFVHDRVAGTTIRASVRSDGTETGFELGSGNASLSTDGQVVAFDSEGELVPQDTGFPIDVFVHDEQP